MSHHSRTIDRPLLALSCTALLLAGCAQSQLELARADTLSLGRNAAGEPCQATRSWSDPALHGLFDASYAIGCRNVAASRSLGFVRVIASEEKGIAAVESTLSCGAPGQVVVPEVGRVEARRCYDSTLGSETVVFALNRSGRRIIGSAVPSVQGPLEEGLRIILREVPVRADPDRTSAPQVDIAALAPAPQGQLAAAGTADFDPAIALQQGTSLNHKGLHDRASRVLNDALSRLPADADPSVRAALLLEAGLADSNIQFTEVAAEHFARADELIAAGAGQDNPFLIRKRDTYRALELLNRRQFREALASLEQLVSGPMDLDNPLQSLAVVRALNQGGSGGDVASAVAVPSTEALEQLVIDAQANWARSVALLGLGDVDGARRALAAADTAFEPLKTERIDPAPVLWLGARIERQRGRLAARRQDWPLAIASFDRALDFLRRNAISTLGTGNEPAIADTQIERAGLLAQSGAGSDQVRQAYGEAIDALVASSVSGGIPNGVERYLDLLVEEAKAAPREDTYERYFRAMQAVGVPAVARQLSQLQNIVNTDPTIGAKVRDRADLERQLTALRYRIADPANAANLPALERERQEAQTKLIEIDSQLGSVQRFNTINDRPATVAEIRTALRTDEVFLKVSELDRRNYGIVITPDETMIYPIGDSDGLKALSDEIRRSIDGRQKTDRKLVRYNVLAAHGLFKLVTGPAMERVARARSIVVDPAGPLQRLPAGVLVTDQASVDMFNERRRSDPFNFTGISFLADQATISTVVSPRSFLVVRALPPSDATKPFIGFAEHVVPDGIELAAAGEVSVGEACSAPLSRLFAAASQMAPIDRQEIQIAANALGVPQAPIVAGEAFTDTAIKNRDDLDQYEVIHFATHGLEEGVWACDKSPPALVTSFGDENSDGLLSFDEIGNLRLNANLVVLSACDTGSGVKSQELARKSGQEEAGSTLQGLVRAFFTANARAVLATHWQASAGRDADEFVDAFYSSARNRSIGESIQIAQRALINQPEFSHPFYWGPYFLVGDSSKNMLSGTGAAAPAAGH
jgi:tetratricopeptide (TPR) repeat protein